MSNKQDNTDEVIPVGTLVTVDGLESEAGKALNGGSAIIVGAPTKEGRYPVLIYALASSSEEEPKLVELKRSIKAKNLQEKENQKCPLYKEAAQYRIAECAVVTKNRQEVLFWLSGYYERWPEDHGNSIAYANALRYDDPKAAWQIMRQAAPQVDPNNPKINDVRYEMCIGCCSAEGDPAEALEWASQITTDTPEHKQLAIDALGTLVTYCRATTRGPMDVDGGYGPVLQVYRSAAAATLELTPENANAMINLGSAESLLGNNKEGVRLYRRAIATGQVTGRELDTLKRDLALAMMQCPGGPMEDYRAIGIQGTQWVCVPKAETGNYNVYTGSGTTMGIIPKSSDGVTIKMFSIPDINDPDAFGNADLPPEE